MARPQSPDYDKRRDAIVAAAARLYAEKGFKGASIADLAGACRTSKSLIYHYFPSKEDILYDVMASHLELLAAAAEEAVDMDGADPRERLRAIALVESQIGEVRADLASGAQARALTMLFFGMINWTHTWFKADGEMPAEALGDLAMDLMLNGLAGLDPQAS
jgi:hypothetical protein